MHRRAPASPSAAHPWARVPSPPPPSLPVYTTSLHLLCAAHHIRPTAVGCGASARPHPHGHHPRHNRYRHQHRHPQWRQHRDLLREPLARTVIARTRRGWGAQATARTARTLRATARPRRGSTSTIPRMATWRSSTATATAARARACCRSQGGGSERVPRPREPGVLPFCF